MEKSTHHSGKFVLWKRNEKEYACVREKFTAQ